MEIMQIVGIGLATAFLIVLVKHQKPEFAMLITVTIGALIFFMMLGKIGAVFSALRDLAHKANVNMAYMGMILKVIGIAYIAEFGAQICRDAGEGTIASKIEFAAKILVMVLAVPIILAILESLVKLLP